MIPKLTMYSVLFLFQLSANKVAAQNSGRLLKTNAANFYGSKVTTDYQSALSSKFTHWQTVKFSAGLISARLTESSQQKSRIGLQINDSIAFNVTLVPSELVASNFIVTSQTPQGKITTSPHPDYFYKGTVNDTGGGDIRLCIKEGFMYGYFRKDKKEYFIEPLNRYTKTALKDEFIFYESTDVIATTMSCGFNDAQAAVKNVVNNQSQNLRPLSPDSTGNPICKKVKFLIATDYSMYKSFNNDIDALQTFLLANLNMAEGLFNTLNLDSTIAGDVGTDLLKFEVTQVHTSVCDSCDFVSYSDDTNPLEKGFRKWLKENAKANEAYVNQFWSTRNLYYFGKYVLGFASPSGNLSNCNSWMNFIKYFTQNPVTVRLQIAHEAGHAFGCGHDNEISPSVTGFIMNSSGNYSPTGRFSRLSDFGGINYSSQQLIGKTVLQVPCIEDCSPAACEAVTGLKISYYKSSDSVKISWAGNGKYLIKYKVKDSANYDVANQYAITGNEILLKNIVSCTNYIVAVQKICADDYLGMISSINFNSSPFAVTNTISNIRGDVYDLKLNIDCKNCNSENVTVDVDHHPHIFYITQFPASVTIPDLFADGAVHRLEYKGDANNSGCSSLNFYKAPYYRENSIKLLNEKFDSCILSAGWKDSVLRPIPNNTSRKWNFASLVRGVFSDNLYFKAGNFDSTCMVFSSSFTGSGSHSLVSKVCDLTKFNKIYLSFDFNYICYKSPLLTTAINAFFKIQVFNGFNWVDVFEQKQQEVRKIVVRNIWDTIPERKFISLDNYINNHFQVKFIVDDGSFINQNTGNLERALPFLYLDNIKLDGYDIDNNASETTFSIFPNPSVSDLFIKTNLPFAENIHYKITDVLGGVLQQQPLNYYRINTSKLYKGIYFLTLYSNNIPFGKTQKFIKN